MVAWDISSPSYDSKSLDYSSETTKPIAGGVFGKNGERLYIASQEPVSTGYIFQYNLTTPYDISTATYSGKSINIAKSAVGLAIKPDGKRIYALFSTTGTLYYYDLSTDWELDSAGDRGSGFNTRIGTENNVRSLFFKPDGTKLYIPGHANKRVYQYSLSTPWDATTGSYDSVYFSLANSEAYPVINFSSDGKKMFCSSFAAGSDIYQYSFTEAWNLSTGSYDEISYDPSEINYLYPSFFNSDGTKMYLGGYEEQAIYQYTLEAGGQDYTETPSDNFNLSDSLSKSWSTSKEYNEAISLTDSDLININRNLTENINLSDSLIAGFGIILSETISLTDNYSKVWLSTKELKETISLSDGDVYNSKRTFNENLILFDAYLKTWNLNREYLETLSLLDTFFGTTDKLKELKETVSLTDNFSKTLISTTELTETINLTDIKLESISRTILDNLVLLDATTSARSKELNESINLLDNYSRTFFANKELIEFISLSDGDIYSINILLTDTINLSSIPLFSLSREIIDTLNFIDNCLVSSGKSLTDTVTLTDNKLFSTQKKLTETLSISDGDTYFINLQLTDTTNLSDNFLRDFNTSQIFYETINLIDYLTANITIVYSQECFETISLSDGQFITNYLYLNEIINLIDNIVERKDTSEDSGAVIVSINQIKPVLVSAESPDYWDYRERK